jgi:hypothetical protein
MATQIERLRHRVDAMSLWWVVAFNAAALGVWMADFRFPDPLPVDRILLGGVFLGSAFYLWRRFFGPPTALCAVARRRLAEMELLFHESQDAAKQLPGLAADVTRLESLVQQVRQIEARIEQTEIVLLKDEYDGDAAAAEVARLEAAVKDAGEGSRTNLEGALAEARKHAGNVAHIKATREELSAAFERIYQLVKRIHSQVAGIGLDQGGSEFTSSVNDLASTIAEYEKEQDALAKAAVMADEEIAAAKREQDERLHRMPTSGEKH